MEAEKRMSNGAEPETERTLLGSMRSLGADLRCVRDELRQIMTVLKDLLSSVDEREQKDFLHPEHPPPQRRTLIKTGVPDQNSGVLLPIKAPERVCPAPGRVCHELDRTYPEALLKNSRKQGIAKISHRFSASSSSVKRTSTWRAPCCINYLGSSSKEYELCNSHGSYVTADSRKNDKKEFQELEEGTTQNATTGYGKGELKQKSPKRASDELSCNEESSVNPDGGSVKKQRRFTVQPSVKLHAPPVTTGDSEQNDICNLCLMNKQDSLHPGPPVLFILDCGHEYHLACLAECVIRRECRKDCPICTKPLGNDDRRTILTKHKILKKNMLRQQKKLAQAVAEALV